MDSFSVRFKTFCIKLSFQYTLAVLDRTWDALKRSFLRILKHVWLSKMNSKYGLNVLTIILGLFRVSRKWLKSMYIFFPLDFFNPAPQVPKVFDFSGGRSNHHGWFSWHSQKTRSYFRVSGIFVGGWRGVPAAAASRPALRRWLSTSETLTGGSSGPALVTGASVVSSHDGRLETVLLGRTGPATTARHFKMKEKIMWKGMVVPRDV